MKVEKMLQSTSSIETTPTKPKKQTGRREISLKKPTDLRQLRDLLDDKNKEDFYDLFNQSNRFSDGDAITLMMEEASKVKIYS